MPGPKCLENVRDAEICEDGMTQQEVAVALGVSRPWVAKVEKRALQKVAAGLGEVLASQSRGRTKCR